jgi:heat shock protein HslJ
MRRPVLALALLPAVLMTGCMRTPSEGPLPGDLASTDWIAKTVAGQRVPKNMAVTLEFASADKIGGRSSCNRYTGPIGVLDGRLQVGPLATTRMACPEPQMTMERAFLAALSGARALRHDSSALVIEPADGGPETRLLPFIPP